MSDIHTALHTVRSTKFASDTHRSTNPTAQSSPRYEASIATAQSSGLPIIDISPFLSPSVSVEAREITAKAINAACINYGFFYLTGHGISIETLDEVVNLAREFFALPLEKKEKIKRFDAGGPEGGDGARGYQGLGENVTGGLQDMQEAIDWYADWDESRRESIDGGPEGAVKTLQGRNLWPSEPKELRNVYEAYIERVKRVGAALVHAMGVALDLDTPPVPPGEDSEVFVRNCADSFWVMRMIGYPPITAPYAPGQDISQFSCGAHTDYGCVTLLLSDSTPGALQVQLKDGTWLPADPVRGAFVVNIGDMIERWTNGLWQSTMHRVIHRGDRYRVSVPFFYEPGFGAVVRPLRKCVERMGTEEVSGGSTYGEHLLTKVFSNFYYSKRTDW